MLENDQPLLENLTQISTSNFELVVLLVLINAFLEESKSILITQT